MLRPPAAPAPPASPGLPPDDSAPFDVTLACGLLAVGVVVSHLHSRLGRRAFLPEAFVLMAFGAVMNGLVVLAARRPLSVARSSQIHDLIDCLLVPPLMLEVGFKLQTLSFLKSMPLALLFGILGTLLCVAVSATLLILVSTSGILRGELSASQCLLYASAAAATEPGSIVEVVNALTSRRGHGGERWRALRHVLVGEAALNGALSVALFACFRRACQHERAHGVQPLDAAVGAVARDLLQTLPGSAAFGLAAGLLVSCVTLHLGMSAAKEPHAALALLLATAFGAYNFGEMLGLSGDLALFVCGATIRHYAYWNVTAAAQQGTRRIVGALAYVGDRSLSLLLGLALVDYLGKPWAWDAALAVLGPPLLLVSRAVCLLPLCAFANAMGTRGKLGAASAADAAYAADADAADGAPTPTQSPSRLLPFESQGILAFAGVRGAVPFALAMSLDDTRASRAVLPLRQTAARLVTSSLCTVLMTNLLLPLLLSCILARLARPHGPATTRSSTGGAGPMAGPSAALLVNDAILPIRARTSEPRLDADSTQQQQQQQAPRRPPPPMPPTGTSRQQHTSVNGVPLPQSHHPSSAFATASARSAWHGRALRIWRHAFGGRHRRVVAQLNPDVHCSGGESSGSD